MIFAGILLAITVVIGFGLTALIYGVSVHLEGDDCSPHVDAREITVEVSFDLSSRPRGRNPSANPERCR